MQWSCWLLNGISFNTIIILYSAQYSSTTAATKNNKTVKLRFMFFFHSVLKKPRVSPKIYVILSIVLLLYTGFRRIDAVKNILWSDWIVSGIPVVRLLTIQAGDDIQRDSGYGGIRQSDQLTNHVSNNGIIRI